MIGIVLISSDSRESCCRYRQDIPEIVVVQRLHNYGMEGHCPHPEDSFSACNSRHVNAALTVLLSRTPALGKLQHHQIG